MLNIRPLSEALARKAQYQLNEDPAKIEENITILRDWILKHPHLKARTDDQFLIAFLRANKSSVERAKQKLEGYYTLRSSAPELFANRRVDDPNLQEIFKLGIGLSLPQTNGEDGPRISIIRAGYYDPSKYNIKDIIKAGTFIGDIELLEDDNAIVSGCLEILDLEKTTAAHLLQIDVMLLKKLAAIGEGGTPLRHKGIHFINSPPGFETLLNLFKGFMSTKNQERLFCHGSDMESLYKYVPRHLLTTEYGGENGSIPEVINYWKTKIESYREYFVEEDLYGIIEEYRTGERKNGPNMFGIDGTFRKLNVD